MYLVWTHEQMGFLQFRAPINHIGTNPPEIFQEASSEWYLECGLLLRLGPICVISTSMGQLLLLFNDNQKKILNRHCKDYFHFLTMLCLCVAGDWSSCEWASYLRTSLLLSRQMSQTLTLRGRSTLTRPQSVGVRVNYRHRRSSVTNGYTHVNFITNPGNLFSIIWCVQPFFMV